MHYMQAPNQEGGLRFMSKDEVREVCPVAFEKAPTNPDLSEQYQHADTETIIDDLAELGWYPTRAMMRKRRKNSTIFSKHMVVFTNPDIKITGDDEVYPQLLVTNSHDGFNAFKFHVGLFRMICSNGLVVSTEDFAKFRIPHKGYTFDQLREIVAKTVEALPEQVTVMNKMQERVLTEQEQYDLALQAVLLRSGIATGSTKHDIEVTEDTLKEILEPIRREDRGDDLWRVFNRVQESMVDGGFTASLRPGKKARKVRSIASFEKDLKVNQELFNYALEMVA